MPLLLLLLLLLLMVMKMMMIMMTMMKMMMRMMMMKPSELLIHLGGLQLGARGPARTHSISSPRRHLLLGLWAGLVGHVAVVTHPGLGLGARVEERRNGPGDGRLAGRGLWHAGPLLLGRPRHANLLWGALGVVGHLGWASGRGPGAGGGEHQLLLPV